MKQRYGEEQIIAIVHEAEAAPTKAEVYRTYGISEQTYYRWRQLYGGLEVPQLRRLKQLEAENARLKRLVAEHMLSNEDLKEVLEKKTFYVKGRYGQAVSVGVVARRARGPGHGQRAPAGA